MKNAPMKSARLLLSVLALLAVSTLSTQAQFVGSREKVSHSFANVSGRSGDTVMLVMTVKLKDPEYYTYGMVPTRDANDMGPQETMLTFAPTSVLKRVGKAIVSGTVKREPDSTWDNAVVEKWYKTVTVKIPVRINPTLPVGRTKAKVTVDFMACDKAACLPPDNVTYPLEIVVTGIGSSAGDTSSAESDTTSTETTTDTPKADSTTKAGSSSATTPPPSANDEIEREKSKGLLSFFLYAMGVGFLALLTPCVFPMIPITVSFFTKRQEKRRGSGFRDSSIFGLGIISTFTAVGILVSLIMGGTAVQDLAANSWMNMAIATLFIVLAFNLFGAFEIQVPVSIMNNLNRKAQGDGVAAVWIMGLTFSLTSFTCTVPFIGTLLLGAANGGELLYPAVGTLGFATAFAMPFVVLSLFPALLVRLPRAGGWMNNLKVVMGFMEIAAAIKFISNADLAAGWGILPRELFLSIWAGVFLLITLYVLGVFEMKLDSKFEKVSGIRAAFAVVFATLTFWFAAGAVGRDLHSFIEALLPPDNYNEMMGMASATIAPSTPSTSTSALNNRSAESHAAWLKDLTEAKAIAAREKKPILIDFTGFTCTNCRLMEKYVFTKQVVADKFSKFVLVQLYTDRKTEPYISNQNIMKEYGTVANPLYVILNPDGSFVAQSGYLPQYQSDPSTFAAFLDKAFQ